jgi:hypothetical protein
VTQAYFICPDGKLINVISSHIDTVIKGPEAFGCTGEEINSVYERFGEPIGLEGKAREVILKHLIQKGWMRIRKYNNHWIVNVNNIDRRINDCLCSWAKNVITGGVTEKIEDRYAVVRINSFASSAVTTLEALSDKHKWPLLQ